eukprot:6432298-Prorocentrum_lima.AAC.1
MDHWVAIDDLVQGYNGEKYGLTFYDRATGWIQCEGVLDKTAESVQWFLTKLCREKETLRYAYSDRSLELESALRKYGVSHDQSIPGLPRNNSWIERSNRI